MISLIVTGFVVGALAHLVRRGKPNLGIVTSIGLGLVGSCGGGLIARTLWAGSLRELSTTVFIVAVTTATLLIGVVEKRSGRKGSTA